MQQACNMTEKFHSTLPCAQHLNNEVSALAFLVWGKAQGGYRSMLVPRMAVPTNVRTR